MELSKRSIPSGPKPSVEIRMAYKRYSYDTVVLRGMNMTVPVGKIYALLGPSGCGKSTLLSCITGQCTLDSGTIALNVDRRSSIGFMPQNVCLYQDLTIHENMLIYGYLYGMKRSEITVKGDELIDLFELPPGDRFVESLSGGQQRRVSLVIAFLHNPSIVILDEPTVGVDVSLTQIIWSYFIKQAVSGQTIIITTHYIQEAYRAHTIGMLREGILIAEDNPQILLERYESDNLEDVFLALSEKQQAGKSRYLSRRESCFPIGDGQMNKPYFIDDTKKVDSKRIRSVLYKDSIRLARNPLYLFTVLVSPIVQTLLFYVAFGTLPQGLDIGFINEEISVHDCNYTKYSGCVLTNKNFSLSCVYMDLFRNRTYKLREYHNEETAIRAVKKNDVWGIVHFVKNYTQLALTSVTARNGTTAILDTEITKIEVWLDLSSNLVGAFVKQEIMLNIKNLWRIPLQQCGLSSKFIDHLTGGISFQPPLNVPENEDFASLESSIPNMLVVMSVCLASIATLILGTEEKLSGCILRMKTGGLSLHEFLISELLIQIALHLVRIIAMEILLYWVLGFSFEGNFFDLSLLLLFIGLLGIFSGIVSSVISDNPTITMIIQNGFGYFVGFCSGLLWPLEGQHHVLRFVNSFLPFTGAASAAAGICLRGFSLTNKIVLKGFGLVTLWTIILSIVLCFILKYRANSLTGKN